ncbi:23S rRNA (uracil(1939)-C(5))-methyltransferase RlmD [Psychrobacter sp. PP-21]|uniref:23S rRNA (uracil(1939)-C(5))-methyltransferase RlmD n=1 Tax=Psychrobacter sp. PP-21 TaxID=2957503 RepID=UPI0029A7DF56|nr:23S rRNA (uracil(1939)-C(5))-methyltransferase RlmD [Psychrobacter sp. PP-21]MDX2374532.1 23S rRNA (uracil(1939)-C(5))-methyltransferase RlmD [Psychrobacter sp. PP-21]
MQPTDSKTPIASDATSQNSGIQTNEAQTNDTQKIAIPPSKKKSKPSSKTRRRLKDAEPIPFNIDGLSHDGRGVAVYGNGFGIDDGHAEDKHGKKIFVSFALPGESALVKITNSRASFEEGDAISITANPNPERAVPPCPHFGVCGGCNLQHWQPDGQINFKQTVLAEMLVHQANAVPDNWLPPVVGDRLGYRTKARLGVRYVVKKETALVGFRERSSNFLAELNECHILDPRIGFEIENLKTLISTLDSRDKIAQLELAMGEHLPELPDGNQPVALIVRNLEPLSDADIDKLKVFFAARNWQLYLQSKGADSIQRIALTDADDLSEQFGRLYYQLPEYDLTFEFIPTDFTQVNLSVNRQMTKLACDLLDLKTGERVLDLFSGLGNFSLPLARLVGETGSVVGVEGSEAMTERAADNARRNGINNTEFYSQDLTQDCTDKPWANQGFDALLIDPPRSGAWEIMQYLPKFNAERIVYVSCNPATLARDTKALLEQGYRLTHAGVMDMFCHTGHVESIARFEKVAV